MKQIYIRGIALLLLLTALCLSACEKRHPATFNYFNATVVFEDGSIVNINETGPGIEILDVDSRIIVKVTDTSGHHMTLDLASALSNGTYRQIISPVYSIDYSSSYSNRNLQYQVTTSQYNYLEMNFQFTGWRTRAPYDSVKVHGNFGGHAL